jgi:hypothetical protein
MTRVFIDLEDVHALQECADLGTLVRKAPREPRKEIAQRLGIHLPKRIGERLRVAERVTLLFRYTREEARPTLRKRFSCGGERCCSHCGWNGGTRWTWKKIRAIGADISLRRSPRCASFSEVGWAGAALWIIVEREVLHAAPSGLVLTAERRVARM